jgi:hypothetical protein
MDLLTFEVLVQHQPRRALRFEIPSKVIPSIVQCVECFNRDLRGARSEFVRSVLDDTALVPTPKFFTLCHSCRKSMEFE